MAAEIIEVVQPALEVYETPDAVTEVLESSETSAEVFETGVPGPPGPASAALSYLHTQASAAAVWTINHNLNIQPASIAVRDLTGQGIDGYGVEYLNDTQVRLTFSPPVAGTARVL